MGSGDDDADAVLVASQVFADISAEAITSAGEGVTPTQLRVLVLASRAGALNNTAVAEALDVHISNASRICDRLVLAGLLHRRDSPADRRHVELTITHRGAALVSAVADHQRHLVHQVLAAMPLRQRAHLTAALTSFTLAAQQLTSAPAAAVSL